MSFASRCRDVYFPKTGIPLRDSCYFVIHFIKCRLATAFTKAELSSSLLARRARREATCPHCCKQGHWYKLLNKWTNHHTPVICSKAKQNIASLHLGVYTYFQHCLHPLPLNLALLIENDVWRFFMIAVCSDV